MPEGVIACTEFCTTFESALTFTNEGGSAKAKPANNARKKTKAKTFPPLKKNHFVFETS